MFLYLCAFMHTLPAPVLNELGIISNHVSDVSPEFLRGIEHVVFTLMLN
ncbi:MAG: hypothetical protein IKF14_13230 [Atopobiaceae bacterium]|nr:hypothetical protein [Atopobiaceae bacterium]